jgi:hypothetical protein
VLQTDYTPTGLPENAASLYFNFFFTFESLSDFHWTIDPIVKKQFTIDLSATETLKVRIVEEADHISTFDGPVIVLGPGTIDRYQITVQHKTLEDQETFEQRVMSTRDLVRLEGGDPEYEVHYRSSPLETRVYLSEYYTSEDNRNFIKTMFNRYYPGKVYETHEL